MSGFSVGSDPLDSAVVVGLLEAAQLGPFTMVTTVAQTLDSLVADNYGMAAWEMSFSKSDGSVLTRRVTAKHNGTASADATAVVSQAMGIGLNAELTDITCDVSGAGAAQVMRLRCTMTFGAGTWKISTWRLPQKPPQYA